MMDLIILEVYEGLTFFNEMECNVDKLLILFIHSI